MGTYEGCEDLRGVSGGLRGVSGGLRWVSGDLRGVSEAQLRGEWRLAGGMRWYEQGFLFSRLVLRYFFIPIPSCRY